MRWPRDGTIWLAALAGFLIGARRNAGAPTPMAERAQSAHVRPARPGWYVALGCLALVFAGGAMAVGSIAEQRREAAVARALTGGEPARGPALMTRFGCAGCHTIAGVPGADGQVGPPLAGLRQRVFVGGVVSNTASNLIAWIVNPRALSPRTAMPVTGISVPEARDVAAFLYTR